MQDIKGITSQSSLELLKQKKSLVEGGDGEFAKHLKSAISEVNSLQQDGDEALMSMATGEVKDLHQAALAINKAETSMKLMLEIRNKALSAYKDLSKTPL